MLPASLATARPGRLWSAWRAPLTPNGLHFVRNHHGTPDIDPARHRLVLHGWVDRPLSFSTDALLRHPLQSRKLVIECGGNSSAGWFEEPVQRTVGLTHGLVSCAEWTGVPVALLLDECGVRAGAAWLVAGGALYATQCSACHGPGGSGGSGGKLAGGAPLPARARADKAIGQFWPFATTVFDYLRRAMPLQAPGSLSDDDSYALSAYLLHLNGLLDADAALDAQRLPAIRRPNRDGFVTAPRDGPRSPQGLAPP